MAIAAKRAWDDPDTIQSKDAFESRGGQYAYLWHWYGGTLFDRLESWAAYKSQYGLYRQIRAIHNPVERLVDFYAGIIYPGTLTEDGSQLPDGTALAIPLAEDTSPELRLAIGQLWQWSNWQGLKNVWCRYGAALGDAPAEVIDDVERGKVYPVVHWPGAVVDLDLDAMGNVKAYVLEWDFEQDGTSYTYRKEVDSRNIRTYRDGDLFEYDEVPADRDNPYGFAPMVWAKHKDIGGDHGRPALRSASIAKLDEVNSLASHLLDREHQLLSAPIVVAGEGVGGLSTPEKSGSTHSPGNRHDYRENLQIIKAGAGGDVQTIQLPEGEVLSHIVDLLERVENDHPELTLYEQLRGMSQVTGPGADRLVGDAMIPIQDARSNYDQQTVKLFQMAVAIAGFRANSDAWGRTLTSQQEVFRPFNLDSYQQGDLNFTIMPRPLLPETATERLQRERMEQALERDADVASPEGIRQRLAAQGAT